MVRRIFLSALLCLAGATPMTASANWSTYQHDPLHTSKADAAGPSNANPRLMLQHPDNVANPENGNGSAFTAGIAVGPDGTVYTAGEDGKAYAFKTDGSYMTYPGIGVCCSPPVVGPDGTIYFSGNELYALNPDFTLKWHYPDGGSCCGAMTVAYDGTIYLGNGWLHALDPNAVIDPDTQTIAAKWVAGFGNWSPAVNLNNNTVYTQDQTNLYAVNTADGALKWQLPVVNSLETNPVIAYQYVDTVEHEFVYMSDDQTLIAVDTNLITDPSSTTVPPAAVHTVVSIPGMQVGQMAYDATTSPNGGTIVFSAYGFTPNQEMPGERIWDADGLLYAINTVNGTVNGTPRQGWTDPKFISGSYGGPIATSPIIDSRGAIYLVSNDYDPATGVDFLTHIYAYNAQGEQMFQWDQVLTYHSDARQAVISDSGDFYVLMDGAIQDFAPFADLAVSASAAAGTINANGMISYTAAITNNGPADANRATLTLSLPAALVNPAIQPGSPACILAGRTVTCIYDQLLVDNSPTVTVTGTAPAYGTTLNMTASVATVSNDDNSANNSVTVPVLVQARDLVISSLSNPPGTPVRHGTGFSMTVTERNQGNAATTGSNNVRFYLSADGTSKTPMNATSYASMLALNPNQTQTKTLTVTTLSTTGAGAYWMMACADDGSVVAESNSQGTGETNNCRLSTTQVDITLY